MLCVMLFVFVELSQWLALLELSMEVEELGSARRATASRCFSLLRWRVRGSFFSKTRLQALHACWGVPGGTHLVLRLTCCSRPFWVE